MPLKIYKEVAVSEYFKLVFCQEHDCKNKA